MTLALASVAPVVLFVGALLAMGLDPLPSSIIVKLVLEESDGGSAPLVRAASARTCATSRPLP